MEYILILSIPKVPIHIHNYHNNNFLVVLAMPILSPGNPLWTLYDILQEYHPSNNEQPLELQL